MRDLNSIMRLQSHENRTPTGRASATATRKLVNYLAYGRGRPAQQALRPQRGVWLDQKGKAVSHDEVLDWVQEQGKQQRFTHQLILSVNEARLSPEEYNRTLAASEEYFTAWRLITHADTQYSHAHVVAFGEEEINVKSPRFRAWWLAIRQELDARQQRYLEHQTAERRHGLEADLLRESAAKEQQRPGHELEQDKELELIFEMDLEI